MSDQLKKTTKKMSIKGFELKEDSRSLYKAVKTDIKDKIEVEIGDSKDDKELHPQAKIMRWDNEVNLSVRFKDEDKKEKEVKVKGDVLEWVGDKKEVHIYEKPDIAEDGGLEIEVVLKEKPVSNVIEFSIETRGLDFFYQPEREFDDKKITSLANELGITTEELKERMQPENVVGSYAVYHKEKQGNYSDKEYKAGKAFHIYRPKVTDADGNEVWGELNIDVENKLLTVTIDEKWLQRAVYPVIVDPTFGYTSLGGTMDTETHSSKNLMTGSVFASGSAGDVTSLSVGTYHLERNFKLAVYETDGTLVGGTGGLTTEYDHVYDWTSGDISGDCEIADDDYVLTAYLLSTSSWSHLIHLYDSGDTNQGKYTTSPGEDDDLPSSVSFSSNDNKYSIYATYEEASSGTEADSERNLWIAGKDTGTSERNIWIQGSQSSSSERGLYIEGSADTVYSRESAEALKDDDTILATSFSQEEYEDVAEENDTYVDLEGIEQYFTFLFKEYNNNTQNEQFAITWKGKSTTAPSGATVYLQVFNRDSGEWETLSSNNSANANTKFTLSGTKTTDLEDYFDGDYIISCRVYQDVS